jgi:hypothetical protein
MPRFSRHTTVQSSTTAVEAPTMEKPPRSGTAASESSELDACAHTFSSDDFARLMDVDIESGLSNAQAQERLQRYGANELEGGEGVSWVSVLVSQIGASCDYDTKHLETHVGI